MLIQWLNVKELFYFRVNIDSNKIVVDTNVAAFFYE